MLSLLIWLLPVFVFVLFAVRQRSSKLKSLDSSAQSVQIHKDRLAALEVQFEKGEMSEQEYQSFKLEEEKALLADSRQSESSNVQNLQMAWVWVPVLTVFAFALAWVTYISVGSYQAVKVREDFKTLAMSSEFKPDQIKATLENYQKLLDANPDDLEGWFRLSRMQIDMELFDGAVASLNHVLEVIRGIEHSAEDEATVLAYLGQAYMSLGQLPESLAAYEESLEYYQNDTALGMAGRVSFDLGQYQKAIEYWTQLKIKNAQADPAIIDDFINKAKAQLEAQGIDYEAEQPIRIIVNVDLPAAWEGLSQDAALFVYARPVGQRMPLAVKRLPVTAQKVAVMLTDADAMGPMGGISTQTVVEVTARVSLTGIANTQPGDWEGNAQQVEIDGKEMRSTIIIQQP